MIGVWEGGGCVGGRRWVCEWKKGSVWVGLCGYGYIVPCCTLHSILLCLLPSPIQPPGVDCVYKDRGRSNVESQQRDWWVFDHELVLPEYILTFSYTSSVCVCVGGGEGGCVKVDACLCVYVRECM